MSVQERSPKVAFLGAGPRELELFTELHAAGRTQIIALFDPSPQAPGFAIASVLGITVGSDRGVFEHLRTADHIILPYDREALAGAVRWLHDARAPLLEPDDARQRWGRIERTDPVLPAATAPDTVAGQQLVDAVDWSRRLQDRNELAAWLLDLALGAVDADGGSVQMLSADTAELYLIAARGLSDRLIRLGRHRVGEGVSGMVAASRMPSVLNGPRAGRIARERGDITASLSVPLEHEGALLGVLNVSTTVRSAQFGPRQLDTIERLAPRIAALLHQATHGAAPAFRSEVPRWTRQVPGDLRARLQALCVHVQALLAADRASIFFTSEAGEWVGMATASDASVPPPQGRVRRDLLTRSLLEEEWLHARDTTENPRDDQDAERAIDRALGPVTSILYAPLVGLEPVGVLVLEFAALGTAERCVVHGAELVQQVALYCDAERRSLQAARRVRALARLARACPRLVGCRDEPRFDAVVAAEAAQLVGARGAIVRRVDESRHTYSRPVCYGLPDPLPEPWRALDARMTERTLQARQSSLTTAAQDSDAVDPTPVAHASRISVPLVDGGRLMAVINVYDKEWDDVLDPGAFTECDREILEAIGTVATPFLPTGATPVSDPRPARVGVEGAVPVPVPPASAGPPPPVAPASTPAAGRGRAPAADAPQTPRERVAYEIARAGGRSVAVWWCKISGLVDREDTADARPAILDALRGTLRPNDFAAWLDAETALLVTPDVELDSVPIEARLLRVVRPLLARLSTGVLEPMDVWIGAAASPADGDDVDTLIGTARERAR